MRKQSDFTILIDIDDTIEDLLGAWCKWLNEHHGTTVSPNDITEWDMTKFFPQISKEEVFEPLNKAEFWQTVKPKEGAADYVRKLMLDDFKVFLCTSSTYHSIKPKYEFIIKKYFPFVKWSDIIIASDKSMIKGDFIIDDGLHNMQGDRLCCVLMTAPHNRDFDTTSTNIVRANNWKEAYEIIQSCYRFYSAESEM